MAAKEVYFPRLTNFSMVLKTHPMYMAPPCVSVLKDYMCLELWQTEALRQNHSLQDSL